MELVNRYVHQVGRRLPKRLRDDVKVELRSLLLDALEERTGLEASNETAFSEDDQVAILEEFGPPAQMAAKYQPQPRHIIGPKVYNLGSGYILTDRTPHCVVVVEIHLQHRFVVNVGLGER